MYNELLFIILVASVRMFSYIPASFLKYDGQDKTIAYQTCSDLCKLR